MHTEKNYRTKKALKEDFKLGKVIRTYQPGGMFEGQHNGRVCIEGPHYPEPHKWYCSVVIENDVVTKIIG